mgnify:CR=1 FL=1
MICPRRVISPADVGGHYDELDPFYQAVWGRGLHHGLWRTGSETTAEAVDSLVEALGQEAQLSPGDRVCDVGCGYGEPARILAERFRVKVLGLTLSERQATIARATPVRGGPAPEFRMEDFLHNGIGDGAFQAVIALESTAHMDEKASFFQQAERVLAPGGRLVVAAWTASEHASSREERWLLEPICRFGRLPGLGTAREYEDWCRRAGLGLVSIRDWTEQVRRTWRVVLSRIPTRLLPKANTWRYLFDSRSRHRDFLLAIPLIGLAQYLGSLRYTALTARKPSAGGQR